MPSGEGVALCGSVCPISTATSITACASGPSVRAIEVALQEGLTSMDARRGLTRVAHILKSQTNYFVDTALAPFA